MSAKFSRRLATLAATAMLALAALGSSAASVSGTQPTASWDPCMSQQPVGLLTFIADCNPCDEQANTRATMSGRIAPARTRMA